MGNNWHDNIYQDIIQSWQHFVSDNAYNNNEIDEVELLEEFKSSSVIVSFKIENCSVLDILDIQNYLVGNGVNPRYLFNMVDIEIILTQQVLENFMN